LVWIFDLESSLKIRQPEIDIQVGKVGFNGNCDLGRKDMGQKLSTLLDSVDEPLVVAVDGPWGCGKTHFLKCWCGAHTLEFKKDATVIYFDAFRHDFLDDPLVALTLALEENLATSSDHSESLRQLKKAALVVGKPLARVGLAVATAGFSTMAPSLVDAVLSASGEEGSALIDKLWAKETGRISAMKQFEKALRELTSTDTEIPQKVIFVIDELDRCRPDYALLLLETVKHFFSIPNIKFALGVNLQELANSVKARYGNTCDSNGYLQKFIDVRLRLESSFHLDFSESTARTYFGKVADDQDLNNDNYRVAIDAYLQSWGTDCPLTLRDVEKLATLAVLTPTVGGNHLVGRWLIVAGLLIIKVSNPELLSRLRSGIAEKGDVLEFFNLAQSNGNREFGTRDLVSHWQFYFDGKLDDGDENNSRLHDFFGRIENAEKHRKLLFRRYIDVFDTEILVSNE
jgi:KAP-like P-loop domain-containing protein